MKDLQYDGKYEALKISLIKNKFIQTQLKPIGLKEPESAPIHVFKSEHTNHHTCANGSTRLEKVHSEI